MAFFDMPLEQLKVYQPSRLEPADFDAFWRQTLESARTFPLNARFEAIDYGLRTLETFDITFSGYGGQPIKSWLILSVQRSGPLPFVFEYFGHGGGRGVVTVWVFL